MRICYNLNMFNEHVQQIYTDILLDLLYGVNPKL